MCPVCVALATAPHVMEVEQGVPFHPVAAEWVDQTLSLSAAGRSGVVDASVCRDSEVAATGCHP